MTKHEGPKGDNCCASIAHIASLPPYLLIEIMTTLRTRLLVFTTVLAVAFGGTMVFSDDTGLHKEVKEFDQNKNGKPDGRTITHKFGKHRLLHCSEIVDESNGKVTARVQLVFHQGKLVMSETDAKWDRSFNSEPNVPASVSVTFNDGKPAEVIVYDAARNIAWVHARDEHGRLEPWSKDKVDEVKAQSDAFNKGVDELLKNAPSVDETSKD